LARKDDEELVLDVVVVERARRLAGRHLGIADPQILDPDHRSDTTVRSGIERAAAPALEFEVGYVDDGLCHAGGTPEVLPRTTSVTTIVATAAKPPAIAANPARLPAGSSRMPPTKLQRTNSPPATATKLINAWIRSWVM